jgi:hypothetical protein
LKLKCSKTWLPYVGPVDRNRIILTIISCLIVLNHSTCDIRTSAGSHAASNVATKHYALQPRDSSSTLKYHANWTFLCGRCHKQRPLLFLFDSLKLGFLAVIRKAWARNRIVLGLKATHAGCHPITTLILIATGHGLCRKSVARFSFLFVCLFARNASRIITHEILILIIELREATPT